MIEFLKFINFFDLLFLKVILNLLIDIWVIGGRIFIFDELIVFFIIIFILFNEYNLDGSESRIYLGSFGKLDRVRFN